MKLLLHTCCAPCAIYPAGEAKKDGFAVTGFFYNPNIHPGYEYARRKKVAQDYFSSERAELVDGEYDVTSFFKGVSGEPEAPGRCRLCWRMRLEKTAVLAAERGFDAFSTTLLASPYQDHEFLKGLCEELSRESGARFYYKDFRVGFREAHRTAREKGMYCQNYCGCVFSLIEREEAKRLHKVHG